MTQTKFVFLSCSTWKFSNSSHSSLFGCGTANACMQRFMNEYITIHTEVMLTFWTSINVFIGRTIGEHFLARIAFVGLLPEWAFHEIIDRKQMMI